MKNKQSLLFLIPKASYYDTQKDVIKEGLNLHNGMFSEDRELYTYLLYFKNATYYSKSLIIKKLLGNSLNKEENSNIIKQDPRRLEIENKLIMNALFNENITHALKLLLSLKEDRINNSRTSKLVLQFIFDRGNTDFIAIKYKDKLSQLIVHALGLPNVNAILGRTEEGMRKFAKLIDVYNNPYALEVFDFVFDKDRTYESEFLKEYIVFKTAFKNNKVDLNKKTNLPIEVLQGFNNFYKRNFNVTSLVTVANTSEKQKIQMQNTVKKHSNNTMEIKIDFEKYSIMDLFKYMYNKKDLTKDEVVQCNEVIDRKAKEIRENMGNNFIVDMSNMAVILDCSDSDNGSKQTKLHPLYKNLALARIFKAEDKDNIILVGGAKDENGLIRPLGHTDLASALIEAVEKGYTNTIVLSDGFENVNSFDKVYKQLKAIGVDINAVHFNPVFAPKNFAFKSISDDIVAMPFTNEKDVENIYLFYLLNTDTNLFKGVMRVKIVNELLNK